MADFQPVVNVPVGFKEIADIMRKVEKQIEVNNEREKRSLEPLEVVIHDVFGREINLGTKPRLLFAGEESGGMIVGQEELLRSLRTHKEYLAMREKSAGEASVLITGLISGLYNAGSPMLSEKLANIFEAVGASRRYDVRKDKPFDEQGGEAQRDRNDAFFLSLAFALKDGRIDINKAKSILREAFPNLEFSNLREILFVGDGTYLEFEDKFVEVRPSGTEAKNRAYSCGRNKENSMGFVEALGGFDPQGKRLSVYEGALTKDERNSDKIFECKQSEYRKFLQRDSNPTIAPELTAQDSAV